MAKLKFIILLSIVFIPHLAEANSDSQTKLIEEKLKRSIENIKTYKSKKNSEISNLTAKIVKLEAKIEKLNRQYKQCQKNKKNSIKKLNNQLQISQNNFYLIQEESRKIKKAFLEYKAKTTQRETLEPTQKTHLMTKETPIINRVIQPVIKQYEWVEIVVENDMNIYELALQYYGRESEYSQIYRANRDVIPETLKIVNGMLLKLPITQNFRERPFILNQN